MKEFFTAELHNTPKKLKLYLPDGRESEHHIMVLGVDSSQARQAKQEMYRSLAAGSVEKGKAANIWIAGLIDSWTFDEECTPENKIKFLNNAPYIADAVDHFAGNHGNFVKKPKR